MTELYGWGAAVLLILVGGGLGWWQVLRHGKLKGQLEQVEAERDVAIKVALNRADPLETPEERQLSAAAELRARGVPNDVIQARMHLQEH